MIGKNESNVSVKTTDTENIVKATISADKQAKLFDLLQNPYSDAIGSIVREITSNCIDSHVEAKCTDKAVIIELNNDEAGSYISFEDFGIGMDEQFMRDRYSKYLDSTKEGTNEQIGFFGIGSKSPLSYTSQFFLNTIKNGYEFQYIVRKDDDGIPVVQKLVDFPTDQANGTRVYFYVEQADKSKFIHAIKTQLTYFNNVFVDDKWTNATQLEYKIFEGRTFKLRHNNAKFNTFEIENTEMHLVIQNVSYPIDWKQMDKISTPIPLGIALKFNIGELNVTMTRENIKYSRATVAIIEQRLTEFYQEIQELSEKSCDEPLYKIALLEAKKIRLNLSAEYSATIINYWSIESKNELAKTYPWKSIEYSGLNGFVKKWGKYVVDLSTLFDCYYISKYYENGKAITSNLTIRDIVSVLEPKTTKSYTIFRMEDTVSHRKVEYMNSVIDANFYLIKRSTLSLRLFKKTFNMKKVPKRQWREFITEYLTITGEFFATRTHKFEDIKIPYEWFLSNKTSDHKSTIQNPFGIEDLNVLIRYFTVSTYSSNKSEESLKSLIAKYEKSHKRLVTLVLHQGSYEIDDKRHIMRLFNLDKHYNIRVIYTSTTNIGILSKIEGFYTMDQLKTNSSATLGAIATTFLIQQSLSSMLPYKQNSNQVRDVILKFSELVPEWEIRLLDYKDFLQTNEDYYNRFGNKDIEKSFGKHGSLILMSLVEAALNNRTFNYKHIETTEFICMLINRYGNDFLDKNLDINNLIAMDIALKRKRIFPFSYYATFYKEHNAQKRSPNTCNVLGLAASLIHKHLITTTP